MKKNSGKSPKDKHGLITSHAGRTLWCHSTNTALVLLLIAFIGQPASANEFYPADENSPVRVTAEDYQPSFRSLANLRGIYVNVSPIRGFFTRLRKNQGTGQADTLINTMRKRVEAAGLVWLSKESVEAEPGQPTLNFYPSFKPGCCTLGLWSGFSQGAKVLSAPQENFRLSSWGSGANHYGGEEGATCLDPVDWARDNIIDKLDSFLSDYEKAQEFVATTVTESPSKTPHCSTEPILYVEMFDTDSSQLGASQRSALNELAATISQCKDLSYRIEAHADQRGSSEYNLALSLARAKAVTTYLVASGVAANRFNTRALGEARLVSHGTSETELAANRRIVITPVRSTALEVAPLPNVYRLLPESSNPASAGRSTGTKGP